LLIGRVAVSSWVVTRLLFTRRGQVNLEQIKRVQIKMCTCLQTTVCICCKTIVISVVIDAMVVFNSNVSDAIVVLAMFLGLFARLPSKLRLVRKREDRKRPSVVHSKPSDF
jgi:hypothetical protein